MGLTMNLNRGLVSWAFNGLFFMPLFWPSVIILFCSLSKILNFQNLDIPYFVYYWVRCSPFRWYSSQNLPSSKKKHGNITSLQPHISWICSENKDSNRNHHRNYKINIESEKYRSSTQFFITFVFDKRILLKML